MQGAQAENAHTVTPAFTLLIVRQLHSRASATAVVRRLYFSSIQHKGSRGPELPPIPPRYAIVPLRASAGS
jgi:hypothetical protein